MKPNTNLTAKCVCRITQRTRTAIETYAKSEELTPSTAIRNLLIFALRAKGLWVPPRKPRRRNLVVARNKDRAEQGTNKE